MTAAMVTGARRPRRVAFRATLREHGRQFNRPGIGGPDARPRQVQTPGRWPSVRSELPVRSCAVDAAGFASAPATQRRASRAVSSEAIRLNVGGGWCLNERGVAIVMGTFVVVLALGAALVLQAFWSFSNAPL